MRFGILLKRNIYDGDKMCSEEKLIQKIDNEIDEFICQMSEKYGIVFNLNDFDWDFEE